MTQKMILDARLEPEQAGLVLSAQEAARTLRISARTLWSHTRRGEIPHVRIGRRILYPVEELRSWVKGNIHKRENDVPPHVS